LRPLASLAGAHHERLDGSGYYRGVGADELTMLQQVLATADAYTAMRQARPHRPPLSATAAAAALAADVQAGRLDRRAVSAVLAAAGQPARRAPSRWPAGLTHREVEVLRLACRGATKQIVAQRLGISAKTVNRHLENSYAKIGVTTRAAAALYAMEHDLLLSPC
jgi:DNA-binding NarL/FixJ family response regulator